MYLNINLYLPRAQGQVSNVIRSYLPFPGTSIQKNVWPGPDKPRAAPFGGLAAVPSPQFLPGPHHRGSFRAGNFPFKPLIFSTRQLTLLTHPRTTNRIRSRTDLSVSRSIHRLASLTSATCIPYHFTCIIIYSQSRADTPTTQLQNPFRDLSTRDRSATTEPPKNYHHPCALFAHTPKHLLIARYLLCA